MNSFVDKQTHDAVFQQLRQVSKSLFLNFPACFISPYTWTRHECIIRDNLIEGDNNQLAPQLMEIGRRNSNLQNRFSQANVKPTQNWKQRAISLMDTLAAGHNYGEVASACLRLADNDEALVRTCVEWSCSAHRQGFFRTYAATRLLSIWISKGIEVQEATFNFIAAKSKNADIDTGALYKLLADLMASRHLSAVKYLQWLMARGLRHKEYSSNVSTI